MDGPKGARGVHCNGILVVKLSPLVKEDADACVKLGVWDTVEEADEVIVDE